MIRCRIFQNILYVDIPKAASTSVKVALGCDEKNWRDGIPWEEIDFSKIKFSFTIVRHPISRVLSTYAMYKNWFPDRIPNNTFDGFIKKVISNETDVHYKSQHLMLPIKNNEISVDLLCKYENLKEEWEKLKQLYLLDKPATHRPLWPDLPWKNKHSDGSTLALTHYQYKALSEKYALDFQILKYEPDGYKKSTHRLNAVLHL